MRCSTDLVERFQRFVSFLKAEDKPAAQDLLRQFESLAYKETGEFGFSLRESAIFLVVMIEHQKKLNKVENSVKALPHE